MNYNLWPNTGHRVRGPSPWSLPRSCQAECSNSLVSPSQRRCRAQPPPHWTNCPERRSGMWDVQIVTKLPSKLAHNQLLIMACELQAIFCLLLNLSVIYHLLLTSVQAMGVSRRMPVMMAGMMISQAPVVSWPSHSASLAPKVRAEDSRPSLATRKVTSTSTWTQNGHTWDNQTMLPAHYIWRHRE